MISEIKAGVILNYISIVIRLGTSFFLTPFVIASLGTDEYGLFMLSNSILAWLSLTDFGLGGTVSKYVATYHAQGKNDEQAHFLGQSMMLFSALGILTLVCGLVMFIYLGDLFPSLKADQYQTLQIIYLLTLGNLILAFPMRPLGCVPWAYQKFIVPGVVGLAMSLLNTGLTVLLLFFGYKAIGLTVLSVALGVVSLLWGMYYTFRCLGVKLIFRRPDMNLFREMFIFSFWILLNQLMDLIFWRTGAPILARVSSMEAVTVFTIGVNFPNYFITASTAISGVIAPKLMHMVALDASKKDLTNVMIRTGRYQLFLLSVILMGFVFLGEHFLRLWVGKSIGNQVHIVWLGSMMMMFALMIPLTQNTGLAILQALNIHKGRAVILFYTSIICLVLGYIMSLYWGALGMFVATSLALIVGQCCMINVYYSRKAGLYIGQFFSETYLRLIWPILLMAAGGLLLSHYFLISSWTDFLIAGFIYGVFCTLCLVFLYFNKEERQFMVNTIHGVLVR